jgi:uncharacterized membrane protein YkoI
VEKQLNHKGNTMKNSIKTLLALGVVTALAAGGTAMVVNAEAISSPTGSDARIAQADNEANESAENEADEGPENAAEDANEVQEMSQYQSLAKITPQQAQQTAEAAQGTAATKVELDVDDGSLVYAVEFSNAEVIVDAGNGQILKTEAEGQEENDATETRIQGSIQVPDNNGGDQGETQR